MVKVFKFGGTCTATPAKLDRISELIDMETEKLVVTCSAAAGVTNMINQLLQISLDDEVINRSLEKLKLRHVELLDGRFELPDTIHDSLERLERLLYGIYYTEELTDRTYDLVMTFGERLIIPIVAKYLEEVGLKTTIVYPEDFLITNGQHQNALALLDETEKQVKIEIEPAIDENDVILVPGFYGISEDHIVTLLGRSGTDYTGTIIAYALNAESVTIWKDVYGFMSADPNIVETSHTIPYLSYQEAAELAYFGAKLLHPRAASPARMRYIPIYIRHIDHLDSITCINSDLSKGEDVIKSVSHMNDLAIVKVYASVGGNTKGVLAKIAEKITLAGGNTISVATSQTCIAFLLTEAEAVQSVDHIKDLGRNIIDDVEVIDNIALICVVGEGLGTTPGIASRVFEAVSKKDINVELISAGASSTAYHFTVNQDDLNASLRAIHSYFFE